MYIRIYFYTYDYKSQWDIFCCISIYKVSNGSSLNVRFPLCLLLCASARPSVSPEKHFKNEYFSWRYMGGEAVCSLEVQTSKLVFIQILMVFLLVQVITWSLLWSNDSFNDKILMKVQVPISRTIKEKKNICRSNNIGGLIWDKVLVYIDGERLS